MIRDTLGDEGYWCEQYEKDKKWLVKAQGILDAPMANPTYGAQFSFDFSKDIFRFVTLHYSRGDPIRDLVQPFPSLLDAWEFSNKLAAEICAEHKLKTCRDWTFELSNLNHYNWCFWLVGLALSLELPDEQWSRMLVLIDGEGEDILLDRIIASRSPGRKIGNKLLHKKPYARLLAAIDAPKENQATLLKDFVEHWYAELKRPAKAGLWWYIYGDPEKNPLSKGSYFGRWCIEAVAAVKAFDLDDSLCLGHEHYPGDLLRPDGPTTHKNKVASKENWLQRWLRS